MEILHLVLISVKIVERIYNMCEPTDSENDPPKNPNPTPEENPHDW